MGHRFAWDTLTFCGDCIEIPTLPPAWGSATPYREAVSVQCPLSTARLWRHRAGAGFTRLQDLRGKAFAFPAADDPLTIWAKARLVDAGILKKDLAFCTNFSNQIEYSSAPNPLRVARRVSRRDTIAGILDGRFHAGVTSYERYTIENHRGLMQVDSYSSSPDILAARQGLPAKTVQAFRNSLNAVKANDWQSQAAMKDAFDHEEPVTGVVAIDDSYFNALREALRKARRFDGEPGSPP